jgi:Protein of unknown function (DUF3738)
MIDTEEYDIVAKMPPGTTKEQFQQMLQNLLEERFHLVGPPRNQAASRVRPGGWKERPELTASAVAGGASPAPSPRLGEVK